MKHNGVIRLLIATALMYMAAFLLILLGFALCGCGPASNFAEGAYTATFYNGSLECPEDGTLEYYPEPVVMGLYLSMGPDDSVRVSFSDFSLWGEAHGDKAVFNSFERWD